MWPSWVFGPLGVAKLPPQMPIRAQEGSGIMIIDSGSVEIGLLVVCPIVTC